MLSKDFLLLFQPWNDSIIHFGILLNKNGDIGPPLIKKNSICGKYHDHPIRRVSIF